MFFLVKKHHFAWLVCQHQISKSKLRISEQRQFSYVKNTQNVGLWKKQGINELLPFFYMFNIG